MTNEKALEIVKYLIDGNMSESGHFTKKTEDFQVLHGIISNQYPAALEYFVSSAIKVSK